MDEAKVVDSASSQRAARISVAFLYHFFPHYRAGVIKELSRRFDSTFVGDDRGAEGIKAHRFGADERFRRVRTFYLGRFALQPGVVWYCLTGSHDAFVFLASPNHISTWFGALIVRLRGKRVVFWGHGLKSGRNSLKNLVRRVFFSLAHGFYTYGWRAKQNAISLGGREDRLYVGFNSLDYEAQLPVRESLLQQVRPRGREGKLSIFSISRLTKLCRYDMLLDAVALAAQAGVRCCVTIVGDGPERSALERQASMLGLDVAFLGAIYEEREIAKLVFEADVTVSPGKVGLTAMHSLMYGTPVISNDNFETQMPEVEAIVPGVTGELFMDGSVSDLADKLGAFARRFPDRSSTQQRCFAMIDGLYNPRKQADVMFKAVSAMPADRGDDAFLLEAQ